MLHPMKNRFRPQIIRSRRRTVALEITPEAKLIVRVPLHTPSGWIEKILAQRQDWIMAKQRWSAQRHQERPRKTFSEGELFPYLGQSYPLRRVDADEPLTLDGEFRLAKWCGARARGIFREWYQKMAMKEIPARAKRFAAVCGVRYRSLELSDARRRWGSCSGSDRLRINWRLVLAPPEVLDYVIAHEIAHLTEKNHSANFWRRVKLLVPDYAARRKWLRENEHLLVL